MLPLIPPKPGADWVGLAVLLGYVLLWVAYMAYHALQKRRARQRTNTLLYGAVRYAAARGDLAALEALSHAPGFDVNSADGGFIALHAACIQGHKGEMHVVFLSRTCFIL